jgi:long-subunit acyl-CoA synthetase (AMP-forming)
MKPNTLIDIIDGMKDVSDRTISITQGKELISISFSELYRYILGFSEIIRKLGAFKNNIGIFMDANLWWIISYLGVIFSKNTVVPFDNRLSSDELSYAFSFLDIKIIITTKQYYNFLLSSIVGKTKIQKVIIVGEKGEDDDFCLYIPDYSFLSKDFDDGEDEKNISSDDCFLISIYPGGSYINTSAVITHRNAIVSMDAFYEELFSEDEIDVNKECILDISPFGNVNHQIIGLLLPLYKHINVVYVISQLLMILIKYHLDNINQAKQQDS